MDDVTQRSATHAMPDLAGLVRVRPGLSGKLLVLTIAFVMLAEILIFVPSIATFRRTWLMNKVAAGATAALVFDAIQSGKAKGRDPILVDTAGRLHTRVNLMNELDKIRRVASRAAEGAPHEVLLVLDATVGQNGLAQAREFTTVAGVTGIVLTKLDGTAKGGVAVAIAHDLKLPILYVGVGEGIDDLIPFSAQDYVDALFQEKW